MKYRPFCLTGVFVFWIGFLQAQTALIRHAPTLNSSVEGSIQQMTAESTTLNGGAIVTDNLFVPGTPTVQLNGNPIYGGTIDGLGATTPANYKITLNGSAALGHVVRRTDGVTLPTVAAPSPPTGSTTVNISAAGQTVDWTNVRNLTLSGGAGPYAVPPGSYGDFAASAGNSFVLGVVGASQPTIYSFQHLTLNASSHLDVVGPVIVTLANEITISGNLGSSASPSWLNLNIASGGLTLNGNVSVYGYVTAPAGLVTINGNSQLMGGLVSDGLTLNGNSLLRLITPPTTNQAPTVTLTSPPDGTSYSAPATVTLQATASDPDGSVAKVEFYQAALKLGEDTTAPFSLSLTLPQSGSFTYTARAIDNLGATTDSSAITITVTSPNQPPTVVLTSPADGTLLTSPATVSLAATASDPDGSISKVEFYQGTTKLGEDLAAPYEFTTANLAVGTYSFSARAYDAQNLTAGSAAVTITVVEPNQSPVVSLTSPANGATFNAPAGFTLTAFASDPDGTVVKVEFFQNAGKIGEDTLGPFELAVTGLAAGSYNFLARATDNTGSAADSAPITVSVTGSGLPFLANFEPAEGYQLGLLNGQNGWNVTGSASIVTFPVYAGQQAVSVAPDLPPSLLVRTFLNSDPRVTFVDFFARPAAAASASSGAFLDTEAAAVALTGNSPAGVLQVYDGNGSGGGTWTATGKGPALDAAGQAVEWHRLTVRTDYVGKRWDMYFNGQMIAVDLGFINNTATAFKGIGWNGHATLTTNFDGLLITFDNPLFVDGDQDGMEDAWESAHGLNPAINDRNGDLDGDGLSNVREYLLGTDPNSFSTEPTADDTDGDGLLDAWERQYFGNLLHPGSEDFDGDGRTNRQEMQQGSDPTDFYNGVLPGLVLVQGDNQAGVPGEFLTQPLIVQVMAAGGVPVPNAPVTFALTNGAGGLAADFGGFTVATLKTRTDATGRARAFFKVLADETGATPIIEASTASGSRRAAVNFSVQTPNWFPDVSKIVVELNAGETTTRGINLYNPTASPVAYTITPTNTEAQIDYVVRTSDDADGPAYVWEDIRPTAKWLKQLSLLSGGREGADLSFSFPYYGNAFNRLFIGTEGYVTFSQGAVLRGAGDRFPSIYNPGNIIAPFWSDLNPQTAGEIYFRDDGDRAIVQYEGISNGSSNHATFTFQVILHRNGDIRFLYKSLTGDIDDAVIGMQDASGAHGVTIQEWEPVVKDNYAVLISPRFRWLGVTPVAGKLLPTERQGLTATFDATQLGSGTFTSNLALSSDYPGRATAAIATTLIVNGLPNPVITSPDRAVRVLVNQAVTLTGTAADPEGPVVKVEYYQGTTKLGEATTLPYAITWHAGVAGDYQFTLRATDVKGAVGKSKPLVVTVDNDNDGDGLGDQWELARFGNLNQTGSSDLDLDGLIALDEYRLGLDPYDADSDDDGLADKEEDAAGLNPAKADSFEDPDGDGYPNGFEVKHGTDWKSATSMPVADYTVDPAGAGSHTTIKAAVSVATKFQIIQVAPGTYQGANNTGLVLAKQLMLVSTQGAAVTKIDGQGQNAGISLSASGVVRGFTIQNCRGGLTISARGPVLIENCIIAHCLGTTGGGLYVIGDGPVELRHCTIVNNRADDGRGVVLGSGIYVRWGVVSLVNSICWNDAASDILLEYGSLTASTSNLRDQVFGAGNLHVDPNLTVDYRLRSDSPLRGAGAILATSSVDMDGESRPVAASPDIGADQWVDSDGDTLPDAWEKRFFGTLAQSGPADFDGDGLSNLVELSLGTDPAAAADADGDGLSDAQEIQVYGSNPANPDSDADGLPDKYEADNGLKIAVADDFDDPDGDGYPTAYEYRAGTNPNNPTGVPNADFVVDASGADGAFTTIQAAINALTRNHQIIRVNPGVYTQSINLFRWPALIISSQGATNTIIDGGGIRRCVTLQAESALVGFHIRNGGTDRTSGGNGVTISAFDTNKQTLIQNCVFSNNRSTDGGAIQASSAKRIDVIIRRCTFLNNYATEGGAALTVVSGVSPNALRASVVDSILWDEPPVEVRNYQSLVMMTNCIVRGGYAGANITAADPLLSLSGHLRSDSPARGRATVPQYRDMDGELVADGSPDIGADEFLDSDGDNLPDWWEMKYFGSLQAQNGAGDADGDGADNLAEYIADTTPVQVLDTDGDGLADADEIGIHHTDPNRADTDGDEMRDGIEIQFALDPLHDDSFDDADGDGYPNAFEALRGGDPHSASIIPPPDYTVALTLPRTHATVKAAVDAASNSGANFRIIRVSPGTYSVAGGFFCSFSNQKILLISSGGAAQTILDGGSVQGSPAGLFLNSRCAVHGFTIRGVFNSSDGGAIRSHVNSRISNCVIRNNRAPHGAAIAVFGGRPVFVHCTVINNTALDSGASIAFGPLVGVELINSILWNPGVPTEIKGDGDLVAHNSIVRGGDSHGGGIDQDPRVTADGHLKLASPARNAGLAALAASNDMDGEVRPVISPDIGADQFSGSGAADADEDGMLDAWEVANGLDPQKVDSYEDADGDGVPNVHEASHNSNPRDPAVVPLADRVVDVTPGAASPAAGIYATLAEAVAALTQPYQIIEVRPGVHAGGVTVSGANARGVLIRSSSGAAGTVVDGAGTSYGLAISAEATLSGLTFANCAGVSGAALNIDATQARVLNCVFRDNRATGQGGAIWASSSSVQIVHSTFYGNYAGEIGLGSALGADGGEVKVLNSILWNTGAASEVEATPAAAASVRASIIRSGDHYTDAGANLGVDPLLSPAFGHLRAGSPAIDTGDGTGATALDMDNDSRSSGPAPDRGADEYVDTDGDGLNDGWEKVVLGDLAAGANDDTDGDGLSNLRELEAGTNPRNGDTDGDGLGDQAEVETHHTNPRRADTDGDGTNDASEVGSGLDPLGADDFIDSDGDGLTNLMEIELGTKPNDKDTDGDGLLDGLESPAGLNPLVADYIAPDEAPPPAPAGLQVHEITPTTVRLSWNAVADPSAPVTYEIWRNDLLIDRTTETGFVDNYVEPGVYAFSYHVLAVDEKGNISVPSARVVGSTASGFSPLPGDADGDGLADAIDARPNDPANAFEDDDGDAIANRDDVQPTVYDGPPPEVKILNNDDRVNYVAGEEMLLTVRVSDPTAKVTMYRNETLLGTANHPVGDMFEYRWQGMPKGVHLVRAVIENANKAKIRTKTFLVDVAEVEAHITFVSPHPGEVFGRNYYLWSRLDGGEVKRPLLRNSAVQAAGASVDFNQGIDLHYERYYRGARTVTVYADDDRKICTFQLPLGEPSPDGRVVYCLVMLREMRDASGNITQVIPEVINPSTPARNGMLVKVANFSPTTIMGGFTKAFYYAGMGGPKMNIFAQRVQGHTAAVNSAMAQPALILPQVVTDVFVPMGSGFLSFYSLGSSAYTYRALPESPHEFPPDLVPHSPAWEEWYKEYGNIVYNYVSFPSVSFGPGSRTVFCFYAPGSPETRGIRWWSDIPVLPEIRLTPFNAGSLAYPGGRGHPANNQVSLNLPMKVNDDADDQAGVADNADSALSAKDDDIVKVNLKVDLRNRTDVLRLRMKFPVDEQGNPILRGFYGSSTQSLTPLPAGELNWLLADHPEIVGDKGLDFYFEGLRVKFDARIEVDVLNPDGVPVNRLYATQGDPAMLGLSIAPPMELAVDADRDGVIKLATEDASDATAPARPYRFWSNDDDDNGGDINGDDVPGSSSPDGQQVKVQGTRDLVDFFPVFLDLKQLLTALPPSASVKYKLKNADDGLRFVYTDLSRADAFKYLKDSATGNSLKDADAHWVLSTGYDLDPTWLGQVKDADKGVILVEGRNATDKPLVLSVEKADGTVIAEVKLELKIVPVETMFRHLNLHDRNLAGLVGTKEDSAQPEAMGDPTGFPDNPNSDSRWLIFVHGFNVSGQKSRGWNAEMFKRTYWSGNKSRFVGVSWFGNPDPGSLGLPADYHLSMRNAMVTAPVLAQAINALPGSAGTKTMFAHSLGCGVISSAIADHGMTVGRVCFVDAALALESFDGRNPDTFTTENDGMTPAVWKPYSPGLYAANWFARFDPTTDARGKLTWNNRFSGASSNVYHFYSSTEDVLAEYTGELPSTLGGIAWDSGLHGSFGWVYQEKGKGNRQNYGLGGPPLTHLGSYYGGWGMNIKDPVLSGDAPYWKWVSSDTYIGRVIKTPAEIGTVSDSVLRRHPVFEPGWGVVRNQEQQENPVSNVSPVDGAPSWIYDLYLGTTGNTLAANSDNRAQLLAEAIPSLTWCMGSRAVTRFEDRNFNLPSLVDQTNWPRGKPDGTTPEWRHSDMREVAYLYQYGVFDKIVVLSKP